MGFNFSGLGTQQKKSTSHATVTTEILTGAASFPSSEITVPPSAMIPAARGGVGLAPTGSPARSFDDDIEPPEKEYVMTVATQFLYYILNDHYIALKVAGNIDLFIGAGLEAFKRSPLWDSFEVSICSIENYEAVVYGHFKVEVKWPKTDLKIKTYPGHIDICEEELLRAFDVAVLNAKREFDTADKRMAARCTADMHASETHDAPKGLKSESQAVFLAAASAEKAFEGQVLEC